MLLHLCLPVLLTVAVAYAALPLPSYIKPCARTDPNFYKCSQEHGQEALPRFVLGDKAYGVPPLEPVEVTEIKTSSSGISMTLTNVKLHGLSATKLKEVRFDVDKKKCITRMLMPRVEMVFTYDMSGRLLLIPITGHGNGNITVVDSDTLYDMDCNLVDKNGTRYLRFFNSKLIMDPKRAYFDLENLFNGDKLLGRETNALLNAEWKDTYKELSPPITEAANQIILSIIDKFASRVPYDVWFPEHV